MRQCTNDPCLISLLASNNIHQAGHIGYRRNLIAKLFARSIPSQLGPRNTIFSEFVIMRRDLNCTPNHKCGQCFYWVRRALLKSGILLLAIYNTIADKSLSEDVWLIKWHIPWKKCLYSQTLQLFCNQTRCYPTKIRGVKKIFFPQWYSLGQLKVTGKLSFFEHFYPACCYVIKMETKTHHWFHTLFSVLKTEKTKKRKTKTNIKVIHVCLWETDNK